jgi:hypothetical protein
VEANANPVPARVCEHLQPMLDHLLGAGAKVVFAGQAWSNNCRVWVYLDRVLDTDALAQRFPPGSCVQVHSHRGTHDGSERGFYCAEHQDAVMGLYPG